MTIDRGFRVERSIGAAVPALQAPDELRHVAVGAGRLEPGRGKAVARRDTDADVERADPTNGHGAVVEPMHGHSRRQRARALHDGVDVVRRRGDVERIDRLDAAAERAGDLHAVGDGPEVLEHDRGLAERLRQEDALAALLVGVDALEQLPLRLLAESGQIPQRAADACGPERVERGDAELLLDQADPRQRQDGTELDRALRHALPQAGEHVGMARGGQLRDRAGEGGADARDVRQTARANQGVERLEAFHCTRGPFVGARTKPVVALGREELGDLAQGGGDGMPVGGLRLFRCDGTCHDPRMGIRSPSTSLDVADRRAAATAGAAAHGRRKFARGAAERRVAWRRRVRRGGR